MLSPRLVALLQRVSRSFYLSVRVLPESVQAQVALGYLLARAADTVADTPLLPPVMRAEVLAELRGAMAGAAPGPLLSRLRELESAARAQPDSDTAAAEQELLTVLGECLILLRQFPPGDQRLIERVLDQLAQGMTVDLQRFPSAETAVPPAQVVALQTLAELDEYTYFAAGCVGEFWTDLMAQHVDGLTQLGSPELRGRGVDLGKTLQLVNVIRDVAADLRAGRCYWPTELLSAHGVSPVMLAEFAAPQAAPPSLAQAQALRQLTAELMTLTINKSTSAWPYVQAIPVGAIRLRLACVWPLLLALATLGALRRVGSPLLCPTTPVKVTRAQVYALVARSSFAALLDSRDGGARLDRLFAKALAEASIPTLSS